MKLWRVLLTILVIAFAIGLLGYSYLNQQLKSLGISDWSIEFERLSINHIIIERLELTIDSLPESSASQSSTVLNLTQILSAEVPAIVPERFDIKSLRVKGTLLPEPISATFKLLNREPLQLKVNSREPVTASLQLTRENGSLDLSAQHDSATLQANYNYSSGQLTADASYLLAAQNVADSLSTGQIPMSAQWQGNFSPDTEFTSLESITSALSGELLLSVKNSVEIVAADSTTAASGKLQLNLSKGVINFYTLELNGETNNLMSLNVPELPVQLESVTWQLSSNDQLALPLLKIQQAVNRTHWPVSAKAVAKGKKNETLNLSSELSVEQKQWQFNSVNFDHLNLQLHNVALPVAEQSLIINKLTAAFSGQISNETATLQSTESMHIEFSHLTDDATAVVNFSHVFYPYSEPDDITAELGLSIHADALSFDQLPQIKAAFNSDFKYRQQKLIGNGELRLGEHIRVQHHSEITTNRLQSKVKIHDFNWKQTPQLDTLLKHFTPQVVISKATINGHADVNFDWNDNRWQLDNGQVDIQQSDWVADTLSAVDSSLNFQFNANNEQLHVNNAQLYISSVQQGFTLGPVTAEFGAQIPFDNPKQSTLNLTSHSIKGLGGSISIPNQSYSMANKFALPVVFEEISLGELMRQYPSNKVAIDGNVSGTIPVHWDSNQFTVDRGYLNALAPGGHLQVDSSALVSVAGNNPSLQTLAGVLSNFYYQQLSTVIDYDKNGKLTLAVKLKGSNPEVENGRPVELNVNLEEDLPALMKGLTLSNSLNEAIRKRVQQKIN
ncbi:YdbH domain-containing protein [Idiomarina abyssalis]|uniref:YdbH domain-containing protein n=1 Tax=Idiomarina abyssalis TaxID=86102 RepID=A0A8I1G9L9_9GAMM|nr:YdbH domain-containing protein [Idiomarina abyssalis]MBJ7267087.1 YdbH domain-containing protein [Idiomarina abyssalis]MBJ7274747.1 YdbH domain-containing protein [Idiomarina abyssalis]MBJ7316165.1 YdbH domain-containing protein [Idiomarina abyssalis]